MTIDAGADAHLEVGPLLLKAVVDLKGSIDKLAAQQAKLASLEEAYHRLGPVDVPISASGVAPTSGSLWLDLGGPAAYRAWTLRRLVVGGLTWATTAAGTANFYMASSRPDSASLAYMIDQAYPMPNAASYTSRVVVLHAPFRLYCEITSPTAGQTYVASGAVEDYEDRLLRTEAVI